MENEALKKNPEREKFKPLSIFLQFIVATGLIGGIASLIFYIKDGNCDLLRIFLCSGLIYAIYRTFTNVILLTILIKRNK